MMGMGMDSKTYEQLGLLLFVLVEIIIYYNLVIKPKLLDLLDKKFVSKELFEQQNAFLQQSLTEIKADLKRLLEGK